MKNSPWVNLAATATTEEVQTDVCIIGAGAAGIFLAAQLARKGKSVVIIEAGPASVIDADGVGFEPILTGDDYPGATIGRYFGMGGSTGRWGGLLIPHTYHDRRHVHRAGVWDFIVDCVERHAPVVLSQLGYRKGSDFFEYARLKLGLFADILSHAGYDIQASLLLPFLRKNFSFLLSEIPKSKPQPRVFYNAVAKDWTFRGTVNGARVIGLRAISRNRNSVTVTAPKYVLAAGAIETGRILLEMDQSSSQPILNSRSCPGCYLSDHLSVTIAEVPFSDSKLAADMFAYRFERTWMRGIRLLEHKPFIGTPLAFAHIDFELQNAGFKLAKELMWAVQGRRMPVITPNSVISGLGDLMKLAWHRCLRSRLYISKTSPAHLQLDMEQHPIKENKISLSQQFDEYGRRRAAINWRITEQDVTSLSEIAGRFLNLWPGRGAGLPDLIARELSPVKNKPHDAYHPVGTCRMGDDEEAVVDLNLKVRGLENTWVVSTGVFPSAGTANPTFSMLCLANRFVDQVN